MIDPGARGHILVVCTGNVCRSPYLERLLAHELDGTGISVRSAGTHALVGRPMEDGSRGLLAARGIDGGDFVAQQLTAELVREAGLVIGAAREHVDAVVRLHPRALRYAFALRDLGDLLADVADVDLAGGAGSDPVSRAAAAAVARRGRVQPRSPRDADVIDPYRQGPRVFADMADQVAAALPAVVRTLRPSTDA